MIKVILIYFIQELIISLLKTDLIDVVKLFFTEMFDPLLKLMKFVMRKLDVLDYVRLYSRHWRQGAMLKRLGYIIRITVLLALLALMTMSMACSLDDWRGGG